MLFFRLLVISCLGTFILQADETPLPLGAVDLAPDPRLDRFKPSPVDTMDLEKAFEAETAKQLDWEFELEAPTELEILKQENELLKRRVSELERRLSVVEAKLEE